MAISILIQNSREDEDCRSSKFFSQLGVELSDREGDFLVEVESCNTTDVDPSAAPLGEDLDVLSFDEA